jgi:hypothetical protein
MTEDGRWTLPEEEQFILIYPIIHNTKGYLTNTGYSMYNNLS